MSVSDADAAAIWGRAFMEALRGTDDEVTGQDGHEVWTRAVGPVSARAIASAGAAELDALTTAARTWLEAPSLPREVVAAALGDAKWNVGAA